MSAVQQATADADVHADIQCDVDRIKKLAVDRPQYEPCAADAPHVLMLIRAAVKYAKSLSRTSTENNFVYHGKRYPLRFTNLGRVKVCDDAGNILGASGYGEFE